MFSQSLLLALWRLTAALPDSSASSHALTTLGSSPVLDASSDANCCWSDVSIVLAAGGRPVVPVAEVVPEVPIAVCSAELNVIDAPVGVDEGVLAVELCVCGVN